MTLNEIRSVTTILNLRPHFLFPLGKLLDGYTSYPQYNVRHSKEENWGVNTQSPQILLFESTHRILKALESLKSVTSKRVVIAREITKMHEEVVAGTAQEVLEYFLAYPDHQKGEFVVIVY